MKTIGSAEAIEMTMIRCPECGHEIDIDEVLVDAARRKARDEFREDLNRVKEEAEKQALERYRMGLESERERINQQKEGEMAELKARNKAMEDANNGLRQQVGTLLSKLERLGQDMNNFEIETLKRVSEATEQARAQARAEADERWRLVLEEKDKTIDNTRKALDDAQRKAGQGSQQIQGEVLEEDLSGWLREAFPLDVIERVKKGRAGADVSQRVMDGQNDCGLILWETKNAKWSTQWISKFKGDISDAGAGCGILLSVNTPEEIEGFGYLDGILVAKPMYAIAIATIMRNRMMELHRVVVSAQGRDERMNLLYGYITGPEFRARVEALIGSYLELKEEFDKERRAAQRRWAKQDKCLQRMMGSAATMYGDFQGIIGSAVEDLPLLEYDDGEGITKLSD